MDKASKFFTHAVLPEVVAKWYTRVPSPNTELVPDVQQHDSAQSTSNADNVDNTPETSRKWCYCNEEECGKMIGCDNENCLIQWFHVKCLRLKRIPKQAWYCPDCRSEQKP